MVGPNGLYGTSLQSGDVYGNHVATAKESITKKAVQNMLNLAKAPLRITYFAIAQSFWNSSIQMMWDME